MVRVSACEVNTRTACPIKGAFLKQGESPRDPVICKCSGIDFPRNIVSACLFLTTSQLLDLLGFDVSEITQTHMGTGWVRETLDHEFTTTRSTPSAAVTR
jgi:hypothetical protein